MGSQYVRQRRFDLRQFVIELGKRASAERMVHGYAQHHQPTDQWMLVRIDASATGEIVLTLFGHHAVSLA